MYRFEKRFVVDISLNSTPQPYARKCGRLNFDPKIDQCRFQVEGIALIEIQDLPGHLNFLNFDSNGKRADLKDQRNTNPDGGRSGKLEAVGKSKNSTHRSYMKASSKEGTLFAERESLKARQEDSTKVNAKLIAAAKAATALRLKLFQRKTARDAAKQGAKAARDAMRRR